MNRLICLFAVIVLSACSRDPYLEQQSKEVSKEKVVNIEKVVQEEVEKRLAERDNEVRDLLRALPPDELNALTKKHLTKKAAEYVCGLEVNKQVPICRMWMKGNLCFSNPDASECEGIDTFPNYQNVTDCFIPLEGDEVSSSKRVPADCVSPFPTPLDFTQQTDKDLIRTIKKQKPNMYRTALAIKSDDANAFAKAVESITQAEGEVVIDQNYLWEVAQTVGALMCTKGDCNLWDIMRTTSMQQKERLKQNMDSHCSQWENQKFTPAYCKDYLVK